MGIKSKMVIGSVLLAAVLGMVACSGDGAQSNDPVEATWIEPQLAGSIVSIPVSEVKNSTMTHFGLSTPDGDIAFMAYRLDGEIYVRSNVCPPCRSVGFALQRDMLVCDTCRTTFKAKTGDGIAGGCVDYPKAAVPYEVSDGRVVMSGSDLLEADRNTKQPDWP